ncbi:MAG: hypothetical protein MJE68_32000 [Proteobacteria bacterium]|nr:hypothetical protein [Pseudomonadota bacterium]
MQILYQGKTDRSHPKYTFPDGFDIFHIPNHWANEEMCLCFFENIIFLYIKSVREETGAPIQKGMVLMDNFSGQTTTSLLEKVEEGGIVIVVIAAGTTDRLQPLNVSMNKVAKNFERNINFGHWYDHNSKLVRQRMLSIKINMGMAVMKEVGGKWLTALYDKFRADTSITMNEFKNVGIVEAVKKAGGLDPDDNVDNATHPPPKADEDPFSSLSKTED